MFVVFKDILIIISSWKTSKSSYFGSFIVEFYFNSTLSRIKEMSNMYEYKCSRDYNKNIVDIFSDYQASPSQMLDNV